MGNFFKIAWKRLTESRVAWMAIPGALAAILKPFIGRDMTPELEAIWGAAWGLLMVFLAVNNPATKDRL